MKVDHVNAENMVAKPREGRRSCAEYHLDQLTARWRRPTARDGAAILTGGSLSEYSNGPDMAQVRFRLFFPWLRAAQRRLLSFTRRRASPVSLRLHSRRYFCHFAR